MTPPPTAADIALEALRRDFPGFQIWHVPCVVDPDTWHARTLADAAQDVTKNNINAHSPSELRGYLVGQKKP